MRYRNRAIAVCLIVLPMLFCLASCSKRTSRSPAGVALKEQVGPPLSDEECTKFAISLKEAIHSGNIVANNLVDWDLILKAGMADVEATDSSRKNFAKGFKDATSRLIADAITNGGNYEFLHVHSVEDEKRILFRLQLPGGAVNYHDWILARSENGQVQIVDLYIFTTGERLTETVRRGFLPVAARESGLFNRLVVNDQEYVKNFPKIRQMNECFKAKKYQEGLTAYRQLPPRMKKDKNILLFRLNLAQNAGEQEYSEAIQDLVTSYPNDPCADFVAIDAYLLRNEYPKVLESIDRLDRAVGGDPYLKVMRAGVHLKSGNLKEARLACQKAIKEDPTLKDGYWSLVNVSLQERKFDETVDLLTLLADRLKVEIGDLTNTPGYEEFVRSPQYEKWLKSREKRLGSL